jgi:hypothetical protein
MFHGLDNQFLYTAYKMTSVFTNSAGPNVSATGTAFFLSPKQAWAALSGDQQTHGGLELLVA